MGWYNEHIVPHVVNVACGMKEIERQREKVVPLATGRVLEVGMGPGLNLPFYDRSKVDKVWGLEPSDGMRRKAAARLEATDLEVEWIDLPGEEIPLDDDSVDTVLLTFTLCSIAGWQTALEQMRRVLKPDGRLLFCEHGEAPDESVRNWQRRLDPYWTRVAGGCHLDRPIPQMIRGAGFAIDTVHEGYIPGPKISAYEYRGAATPV
jgi:ubiquinone/menaquinone biosynthesis C-methylase UbiE